MTDICLLRNSLCPVFDSIAVANPTVGEILDFGEDRFYRAVSLLISTPYEAMVALDDIGVDYEKISSFDLFASSFKVLDRKELALILPGIDRKEGIPFLILALDQSTKATGFSLFLDGKPVQHNVLRSDPKAKILLRMQDQYRQIANLLDNTKPNAVCLEATQYQNNFQSYAALSQLQGVIFALLFERGIPFVIVEASAWRSYLGVKGRKRTEQKQAAIQAVHDWYGLDAGEDEAEAICIGRWAAYNLKNHQCPGGGTIPHI